MTYLIIGICSNILIIYDFNILSNFSVVSKIVFVYFNSLLAWIVSRFISHLSCDRISWGSDSVFEIVFNKFEHLACNIYSFSCFIFIEVVYSKHICIELFEDRNSVEGFSYNCSDFNCIVSSLVLPVIKHLTLNKGIIRYGRYLIASGKINKVLRL